MKRFSTILIITIVLSSCAIMQSPQTLGQVKENSPCLEYAKGMAWRDVSGKIGPPDVAPLPESGSSLSKNSRVYHNMTVIFYTEPQEVKEGEKTRFKEVVYKMEICKKR
jgi:hypothetical protein